MNALMRRLTGVAVTDYGCMLRAYRRDVVVAMLSCSEKTTFIPVLANSFARRAAELEVAHQRRGQGESKYGLLKLIALQFDLLTSMTTFPIRARCLLGGAMAATGVGLGLCLLVARLLFGAVWAADGVFTLFAVLFFFLGAQFFGLGLLGEYIGRIFIQVRGRPAYFIHHKTDGTIPKEKQPEAVALAIGK
jgi:undecaprenyl-phosphate 4-deoxy-4-formamido-L-arabinose transferase